MNEKELRIGNMVEWVFPNNPPKLSRTEWITKRKICPIEGVGRKLAEVNNSLYSYHQIQPIPITEDWLLKFGFNTFASDDDKWWRKGMVEFQDFEDGEFQYNETAVVFKHVHQLQNLYFALTQTELTIK